MSANKRWRRHKMCDVHFGHGFLLATGDDQAATEREPDVTLRFIVPHRRLPGLASKTFGGLSER